MERHFEEELTSLRMQLLAMGGLAEDRLRRAVDALLDRDVARLEAVPADDADINRLHIDIDDHSLRLLALHQPVAVDLRAIVSAVRINTDLERVGDLAVNIAEAGLRLIEHPPIDQLADIRPMAATAGAMLRDALDAFVRRDEALARRVLGRDDELDALTRRMFTALVERMTHDARAIEPAVELLLVSRHLERIGDHATNIAENIIFLVSARDVRHRYDEPA